MKERCDSYSVLVYKDYFGRRFEDMDLKFLKLYHPVYFPILAKILPIFQEYKD